ncbi:MAG: HAD hydrolase-like protein [Candidatus Bathyarchaeota archaeon]|nr:HAD hydrolase-like protein [Candidatus Bathyarchaeota archaeon]
MVRVKAILLDLDGTIFDITERDSFACYQALRRLGYDIPLDAVRQHYGLGIGRMGVIRKLGITLTEKKAEDFIMARFASFTDRKNALNLTRIHRGVNNTLSLLAKKYKLILVTSRGSLSSVEKELEWFKIKKFFDLIVTREVAANYYGVEDIPLLPFREQRTKLYNCVIGLTKIRPQDMVCVGDSLGELEPAQKLQITTISVLTGMSNQEDLENASIPHNSKLCRTY